MAGQGTRSEASIDIEYDEYIEVLTTNTTEQRDKSNFGDSGKNSAQTEGSPTDRRKRKRLAPPSTPKLAEGFGNSESGELLKNVPQLEGVFKIIKKVGEGTFSNVYLAQMIDNPRELVALKHIIPTSSPLRIENELRCLLDIGGRENVIGIKTTLRHNDHVVFVLPYVPHQKFQEYILDMSVCEIREYMRNLFIALKRVHSFNIIHRDVKPSNFLFSSELKSYTLVDFGLAMPIPGATDSILGPSKQSNKNSTQNPPKFTSPINYKIPKKRSARHSPHLDAGSERSPKERKKEESASSKQVLKQSSVDNINSSIQFTRSTKSFQLPSRNSSIRIKRNNSTTARNSCKPAQVLCPLRHGPNEICAACMARGNQNAPRAGTPGFRSLEVLCKYPDQTTAVDIWSAGIMFLCVLSGRYPFFKAYDDLTALAQLITIFGSKETAKAAFGLGKDLVVSSEIPSMNLSTMCQKLRQNVNNGQTCSYSERRRLSSDGNHKFTRKTKRRDGSSNTSSPKTKTAKDKGKRQFVHSCCTMCKERSPVCDGSCKQHLEEKQSSFTADFSSEEESFKETDRRQHLDGSKCSCTCIDCCWMVPHSAYDLLEQCLKLDPRLRISADEALRHPFFSEVPSRSPCVER